MLFLAFVAIGSFSILLVLARVLLALFGPALPYRTHSFEPGDLSSDHYARFLGAIANADVRPNTEFLVLKDGEEIYSEELAAIHSAQSSIHLESYEFLEGDVTRRFLAAMIERARAGVQVRLLVDTLGSFSTHDRYFRDLRAAGGHMLWYHPLRWDTWPKMNNRTHRKMLLVDGKIGFVGGADWADEWVTPTKKSPPWRDTMFRVEGDAVADLQAVFAENWLESSGTILTQEYCFSGSRQPGGATALVVDSTPHKGQTRARILFQLLLDSARESIDITTPYFLPDKAARRAMIRAVRRRGVRVRVLAAGQRIDHPFVRRLSHALEGSLLKNGVEIYDFDAAMIHAKIMVIDRRWSAIGSTNFDHRSFGLNDEVNIAALDETLARRLLQDFEADLQHSRRLSYEHWKKRELASRIRAWFLGLFEREE